jgi:hypothetical protein
MVHGAFLIFAQEFFKFFICLFWRFCFYYSHAIHHAVDMRIDTDKGHIVEMREDDFRRFDANSGESADGFERMRDFSFMFVHQFFCRLKEMFCFHTIIIYPAEHHFDFFRFEIQEVGWGFHDFKEFFCGFIHSFIRHLC